MKYAIILHEELKVFGPFDTMKEAVDWAGENLPEDSRGLVMLHDPNAPVVRVEPEKLC